MFLPLFRRNERKGETCLNGGIDGKGDPSDPCTGFHLVYQHQDIFRGVWFPFRQEGDERRKPVYEAMAEDFFFGDLVLVIKDKIVLQKQVTISVESMSGYLKGNYLRDMPMHPGDEKCGKGRIRIDDTDG
ncbi:MAG: hypothetical protein J6Y08_10415 [Clostridiales bacterium]|nr:hypothetical protein [Clostridiales bacterium]